MNHLLLKLASALLSVFLSSMQQRPSTTFSEVMRITDKPYIENSSTLCENILTGEGVNTVLYEC